MAEGVWISSYCLHTEGFPKLLYATMQRLGIQERLEYEGHEYEEYGTEHCEVTIYIAKSEDFPNIAEAWSMTATGFRYALTLEHLDLSGCNEIISLKIPSVMQKLSLSSTRLICQIIENKAPSLSSFHLIPGVRKLSLGEASQMMKELSLFGANAMCYGRAELPSIMPNLESLSLGSSHEPMLPTKFVNLKHLYTQITSSTLSPSYDYSSLVSFLDASPSLETWWLEVPRADMGHELVGPSSHLRQLPERHHHHLKIVEMIAFNSTKSLVELTCCIVKSAVSLERLTFDTFRGDGRSPCCSDDSGFSYSKFMIEQASRAVEAIRMYIEQARCHANAFND
ncbi:uncharacterized protein [Miscanthus floridulus]|uniref:uncharacterized protein n=1 Tax=Miscanthus floridulus TaxID=154761 RepID=UPI00345A9134